MADEEHYRAHWEHALQVWKSEEENARRLAGKKVMIVGVPLAFGAVVSSMKVPTVKVVTAALEVEWPAVICALAGLVALLCMFGVLIKALPIRWRLEEGRLSCSGSLNPLHTPWSGDLPHGRSEDPQFPSGVLKELEAFTAKSNPAAWGEGVYRLLLASKKLSGVNDRVEERLQRAIWRAFLGLAFSALAGISYILVVDPADATYKEIPGGDLIHAVKGASE